MNIWRYARTLCISVFSAALCIFGFARPIFAVQEFTTTLQATYSINPGSAPLVKNEIHIKNNFSTIYSTQYAMEIGSTELRSIRAYDADGKDIVVTAVKTDKKTSIALTFPNKVVGKDHERVFTIEYEHPDAALISGKVLEIDVPRLADTSAFQQYLVRIVVPTSYGSPSAASPPTYSAETKDQTAVYVFSSGAESGINILFGNEQYYALSLKYHVNNPSISQGISQIALPPDTSFQKIVYTSIDPRPDKIESDVDGNWIATYTIEAQKELTVIATGIATIFLKPTVQALEVKPDSIYLQERQYWETSNPEVQKLAKELKTPRAIYDYLTRTYSYDYSRLALADQRRRGAAAALQSKTDALCQEFTDSFIAIARAAGIPARELNGFAYTENPRLRPLSLVGDLLHAWPEYYDAQKKLWIPIDPTWGNTTGGVDFFSKLDFNHIVFAIHGVSSEKPYPAGVYKIQGKEGRDVEVKLSSIGQDVARSLSVSVPTLLRPNIVSVRNLTGSSWYDIPIFLRSQPELRFTNKTPSTITLLPFEQKEVEVSAYSTNWITKQKGSVTITIGDESVQYETTTGNIDIGLAVGIGFGVSIVIAGCVLVFGPRLKRAIRR